MAKLAVIQKPPVLLDKKRTIQNAVLLIDEAAKEGAKLVIFPEAFIPGYPAWIWRLRPGGDWGLTEELHTLLLDNAVNPDSGDMGPLYKAAKNL